MSKAHAKEPGEAVKPPHQHYIKPALLGIDKVSQTLKRLGMSGRWVPVLGWFYEVLGRRQLAREWLTNGLDRRSRHLSLARIAYNETDHEAMKNHLKQYLEAPKVSGGSSPQDYILHREPDEPFFTAIMLVRSGFFAESEKILLEVERRVTSHIVRPDLAPFSVRIEMARGVLKLSQGNTAEGIAMLESTLPLLQERNYINASEILAEAYSLQGDLVEAIQLLEKASRKTFVLSPPLWLRNQAQLVQLYREMGRDEDGRKIENELRKRLALADPDHPILRQLDRTEDLTSLRPAN